MGEFDLALEDIFQNEQPAQEPRWYPLKSKRRGVKKGNVSGEVLLQFTMLDSANIGCPPQQVMEKFKLLCGSESSDLAPETPGGRSNQVDENGEEDEERTDDDEEPSDETDDQTKPESVEKRRRRLRIRGLRRKRQMRAYEFTGGSDVMGIAFINIQKITDLPPERNMTRTSFDMDPFVVASLGKKTYRTRVIRHNLNPVFNEKMIFQVLRREQTFSLSFTVIDRDKLSGNDFIASAVLPITDITATAPEANPETGLYALRDPPDAGAITPQVSRSRFKLPLSRSASSQSLNKLARPPMPPRSPTGSFLPNQGNGSLPPTPTTLAPPTSGSGMLQPSDLPSLNTTQSNPEEGDDIERRDPDLHPFTIPLKLKNAEKWEEKHSPVLYIEAKYLPYPALRQQFWRAMLKQYDSDESGRISKVELTTMLDTLGSTLKESTIEGFFKRFRGEKSGDDTINDLSIDEAVICLEDQLFEKSTQHATLAEKVKHIIPDSAPFKSNVPSQLGQEVTTSGSSPTGETTETSPTTSDNSTSVDKSQLSVSTQPVEGMRTPGDDGDDQDREDLNDKGEEHVVEIRECPICHQPRLNKRSDADIITHIATCASQDWRQVNNIVMAGFVTSSQAQRKWYSKVITKISYGGYKLGANSANILVQDRITGQINEERMSVYVRLGIRLLYKGLKSKDMETKRSMRGSFHLSLFKAYIPGSITNSNLVRKLLRGLSFKQGLKYDDPASKAEIQKFINFHKLDMSEVLLPIESFKNFNEFFYRQLKADARPCSAPDEPKVIVSPADCRSVVFNHVDDATRVWVKGREFSIQRLLGNAYPEDAQRYVGGALGIFRLAPQDYHRFHIPVDGTMGKPKTIDGEYYTVNPMAIRSALDVYGENVRVVLPIDSVAHGRVMVICVGAMMVGSTVITRHTGEKVKRAEELGYFKFGGSTLLLLFEEGTMQFDDDLVDNSNGALETLVWILPYPLYSHFVL
jgi:phosphatidylserine decarboxylase